MKHIDEQIIIFYMLFIDPDDPDPKPSGRPLLLEVQQNIDKKLNISTPEIINSLTRWLYHVTAHVSFFFLTFIFSYLFNVLIDI